MTGHGLGGPGSIPGMAGYFSSPKQPDRFWGPHSLLSNGYQGLFHRGKEAEVKNSGVISPLLNMSSWRDVHIIKYTHNFTFYIFGGTLL